MADCVEGGVGELPAAGGVIPPWVPNNIYWPPEAFESFIIVTLPVVVPVSGSKEFAFWALLLFIREL